MAFPIVGIGVTADGLRSLEAFFANLPEECGIAFVLDPGVKAIVSSGYSNGTCMADYQSHGFCVVIPKPFRLEELGETLRQVIGRS